MVNLTQNQTNANENYSEHQFSLIRWAKIPASDNTPPQTLLVGVVSKSKLPPTTHENHKYIGTLDWILGIYPTDTCKHVKWPVHKRTDDSITGYGKRLDTI